jgi:hypothetical protein
MTHLKNTAFFLSKIRISALLRIFPFFRFIKKTPTTPHRSKYWTVKKKLRTAIDLYKVIRDFTPLPLISDVRGSDGWMVDHCRRSDVRGSDGWMVGCSWFVVRMVGCSGVRGSWFGWLDVRVFVVRGSDGWMFGCSWFGWLDG